MICSAFVLAARLAISFLLVAVAMTGFLFAMSEVLAAFPS